MSPVNPTAIYEIWQHSVTGERWMVRVEYDAVTGIYGPLAGSPAESDPPTLDFEDHPDDLEWFVRDSEAFRVTRC
jgi:hypothetical protein